MRKRYGAAHKDGSLLAGATLYCDTAAMNILHPPATSRTLYKASGWAVAALVLARRQPPPGSDEEQCETSGAKAHTVETPLTDSHAGGSACDSEQKTRDGGLAR